ncbi:FKBP-type peptidyl-prolyl cis-trans isomerase [Brevundimonas lutea]|uniref:FKBP-type peptidyl-prolyl cis-trans isomerase n=1 Tax=Brevundimonas lutea TaxID=2293980 RepID=UPI000F034F60|nr:FKBP-type peptidyl-prolyl cis-trans isomerase [Brevundimonas lutea]
MIRALALAPAAFLAVACASAPPVDLTAPPEVRPATGEASQANWEAGQQAYLDWSAQRKDWTTTASGLQYRRVSDEMPQGDQPAETDTVRVHYRGVFIDGREFDSSYSRNEPAEFPLNRVIDGWTEGVALMREGETFDFVIPANLAYGSRVMGGGEIPANSTLLFRVQLLEVNPAA